MPLSNLRKGMTKVIVGQAIDLISTLLTFLVGALFYENIERINSEMIVTETGDILNILAISGLSVLSLLLSVAAAVMYIIGLRQAGKEEIIFRVSLICFCVCLPLKIVVMYFIHMQSSWYYLADTISTLIYMMAVLYLIQGVRRTADRLDDKKAGKRSDILFRIMTTICVTEAFAEIAVIIVSDTPAAVVSPAISLLANILSIVQYIVMLVFLGYVMRMLKKEQVLSDKTDDSEILSEK